MLRHCIFIISLLIFSIGIFSFQAKAQDAGSETSPASYAASFAKLIESFKNIGITIDIAKGTDITKVTITLDAGYLSDMVSMFQSMKVIINPDVTQTMINTHEVSLSEIIAENLALMSLHAVYEDNAVDNVKFLARLDKPDEYGQQVLHDLFSFNFTRQLYKKINWKRMGVENLDKAAKNFHSSAWATTQMNKEMYR